MEEKDYRWDSNDYARHSSVQYEWARELIAKLDLRGTESVLDIGCGDGKVTAAIAEHVPDGREVGIDKSEDMIHTVEKSFPPSKYQNLTFCRMDASQLEFDNEFDVAFSNASLHWVKDHLPVLTGVKRGLRRAGRVLFQMGGKGNAREVLEVLEKLADRDSWKPYLQGFPFPYGFYGSDEYRPWLKEAGLREKRLELIPKDMKQKGKEGLAGWIRTTWLPYTERVPTALRDTFIAEIVDSYLEIHPLDSQGFAHVKMARLEVEADNPWTER